MPIGDYTYPFYQSRAAHLVVRLLGTPDLHSHLRIAPVLDFFKRHVRPDVTVSVLEVGCGSGLNLFELGRLADVRAVGYDLKPEAIAVANEIAGRVGAGRVEFYCRDAALIEETRTFDWLLLIDVLEHLETPGQLLEKLDANVKEGGLVLISVPTPCYPRVFGEAFHREVGHVVDGYRLAALDRLLPAPYERVAYQYNTGLVASLGCALYYRFARTLKPKPLRWMAGTLLLPFKWLDFINNERVSCSLFAAYRKGMTTSA